MLPKKKYSLQDISIAFLGYVYTIFLPTYFYKIYLSGDGNIKTLYIFVLVIATDTYAYMIGKKFGKHKLIDISPKKSIEGSVAGTAFAISFAILYAYILNKYGFNISYLEIICITTFLSIISQIGDLAASYIKRQYGKKDFGNIMGGHRWYIR